MKPYFFPGFFTGGGGGELFGFGGFDLPFRMGNGGGGTCCRLSAEMAMVGYLKKFMIKNVTSNAIPVSRHIMAMVLMVLSWKSHSV